MDGDKDVLKRTWDELRRAGEEAKKALEEAERLVVKAERKRKKAAFRESICVVLQDFYSGEQFKPVRDAGVDLSFSTNATPGVMSKITFTWSKGNAKLSIQYFFYDEENGADSSLSIEVKTNSETFYLDHLSARNAEKWREAAQAFGMPECLLDSARITEFCVALMAPYATQEEFERYVDSLDTIERDGTTFYAGHGGYMPVVFKPNFRKEDGFYLGVSC